jgi:hypothetical protein
MNESPYDIKDPTSIHGAQLKRRFGLPLTTRDMVAIIEADPDLVPDDEFRSLLLDVLCGKTGARKGRLKKTPGHCVKLVLADMDIEDRAAEIWREGRARPKGAKRVRGEAEPVVITADEIARELDYATGRGLLNAISALR